MLLCGCHRDIQNTEAVRQGILKYLAKRADLSSMDVTVANVSFRSDEADANVHFQAKGSSAPGSGLDIRYILVRRGNEWEVKGRSGMGTGANPHGTAAGMGAHGGMGSAPALPPGHPPIGAPPPAANK